MWSQSTVEVVATEEHSCMVELVCSELNGVCEEEDDVEPYVGQALGPVHGARRPGAYLCLIRKCVGVGELRGGIAWDVLQGTCPNLVPRGGVTSWRVLFPRACASLVVGPVVLLD